MFSSLGHIAGRPQLLVLALMIFVQGSAYGSTLPYLSVTAIGELGMSEKAYSLLVFVSSLAAVTISVSLGILSDTVGDRRQMIIALSLMGIAGYGAIFLFPSIPVFIGATALVIPFFNAVASLIFVSARAETADFPPTEAASINATLRAFISAAWVIMPAALGLALAGSASMLGAWGVAGLCALFIFLCSAFLLKGQPPRPAQNRASSGFFAALKELGAPIMLARMISMASITATIRLSATVWPLILTLELGGKTSDVGLIAGMTALIEIPFMLIWAGLLKRFSILSIIVAAALLYGCYMTALSFAAAPWHIYALSVPGAAAAAALLAMPLNYFQELFPGRPGLGTAFNPINSFLGNAITAVTFAAGSHYLGYSGTIQLGVALALAGISILITVERVLR
ncbi:MFS transporter [Rhizobium sp. SL42]|uniref:MFS transporter n=1 Tax=Rhizobium sp. SL42 TaxID=2806346 RepID=UPI001F01365B|nr:MFS transporter [Rhizobium sp. SL42]UJW73525.1 MFS transporter [Rhizobium sp. SL42]